MLVTPSIFSTSPRTEAAQPPHVILGTLRLTRVKSDVAESLALPPTVGAVDSISDCILSKLRPIQIPAPQKRRVSFLISLKTKWRTMACPSVGALYAAVCRDGQTGRERSQDRLLVQSEWHPFRRHGLLGHLCRPRIISPDAPIVSIPPSFGDWDPIPRPMRRSVLVRTLHSVRNTRSIRTVAALAD